MTLVMYDSIEVDTIPADAMAAAGYVGGQWPNFESMRRAFPHAHVLSIAPEASMDAECLDVEPLDATNAQAAGWFHRQKARGITKPVVYTSASNVQALINALAAAGINRNQYLVWSAHYTYSPHICSPNVCGYPQADGTQWTDHALGRNLDQSLISDAFFGPPAPPPDPHHYRRFDTTKRKLFSGLSEVDLVKAYDKYRALQRPHDHPDRPELAVLRKKLALGSARLYFLEHEPGNLGDFPLPPTPGERAYDNREWRRTQMADRAKGQAVKS